MSSDRFRIGVRRKTGEYVFLSARVVWNSSVRAVAAAFKEYGSDMIGTVWYCVTRSIGLLIRSDF